MNGGPYRRNSRLPVTNPTPGIAPGGRLPIIAPAPGIAPGGRLSAVAPGCQRSALGTHPGSRTSTRLPVRLRQVHSESLSPQPPVINPTPGLAPDGRLFPRLPVPGQAPADARLSPRPAFRARSQLHAPATRVRPRLPGSRRSALRSQPSSPGLPVLNIPPNYRGTFYRCTLKSRFSKVK